MPNEFRDQDDISNDVDVHICVFPHLPNILVVDLRNNIPSSKLLSSSEIFDSEFFEKVEQSFKQSLHAKSPYPFLHMMNVPVIVYEMTREMGLSSILKKLDLNSDGQEPRIAITIMHGDLLSLSEFQLTDAFTSIFSDEVDTDAVADIIYEINDLVSKEKEIIHRIGQEELLEALQHKSSNFFTIWDNQS